MQAFSQYLGEKLYYQVDFVDLVEVWETTVVSAEWFTTKDSVLRVIGQAQAPFTNNKTIALVEALDPGNKHQSVVVYCKLTLADGQESYEPCKVIVTRVDHD